MDGLEFDIACRLPLFELDFFLVKRRDLRYFPLLKLITQFQILIGTRGLSAIVADRVALGLEHVSADHLS
jgi:hypothetical protein